MPKYRVTSPEGSVFEVNAPEGATEADVMAYAKAEFAKSGASTLTKPEPVDDFSGNLRFGSLDTGIPLPQSVNKGLAQIGSGMADWGVGAQQMLAPAAQNASLRAEASEKRGRDKALNTGFMGAINNFVGKVAPSLAMPNVGGAFATGALGGAVMGAFEPVAGNESRGLNMGIGAVAGGALPGVLAGFKKAAMPDAATADLARTAMDKYGIPLGISDMSANKLLKGTRSVLNDTPFVGSIGNAQKDATQGAFNAAVGGTFGASERSLTPAVMGGAKARIGGEMNRVWENNTLKLDGKLIDDINALSQKARDKLLPDQAAMVDKQIQSLLSKAENGEIPGGFANNWQSELRMSVDGESGLAKSILGDLRGKALAAFNRGVSPADAAALTKARGQYGNFKTVEPLLTKGELGVAGRAAGDVPASLLPQTVNAAMGSRAVGSELGELSQIGGRFLTDRTAQTGGSPRALIQNSILGAGLTSGGYAGMGLGGAIVIPALAGASQWALGSPALTKAMLKQAQQRGLLGAPQLTPAMLQALKNGLLAAPAAAAGPGLLGLNGLGS